MALASWKPKRALRGVVDSLGAIRFCRGDQRLLVMGKEMYLKIKEDRIWGIKLIRLMQHSRLQIILEVHKRLQPEVRQICLTFNVFLHNKNLKDYCTEVIQNLLLHSKISKMNKNQYQIKKNVIILVKTMTFWTAATTLTNVGNHNA